MSPDKDVIVQNELLRMIGTWKCPICGNKHFRLLEGFSRNEFIDFESKEHVYNIPVISIGCERCGFISQHALGALGFLDMASNKKGAKNG